MHDEFSILIKQNPMRTTAYFAAIIHHLWLCMWGEHEQASMVVLNKSSRLATEASILCYKNFNPKKEKPN